MSQGLPDNVPHPANTSGCKLSICISFGQFLARAGGFHGLQFLLHILSAEHPMGGRIPASRWCSNPNGSALVAFFPLLPGHPRKVAPCTLPENPAWREHCRTNTQRHTSQTPLECDGDFARRPAFVVSIRGLRLAAWECAEKMMRL